MEKKTNTQYLYNTAELKYCGIVISCMAHWYPHHCYSQSNNLFPHRHHFPVHLEASPQQPGMFNHNDYDFLFVKPKTADTVAQTWSLPRPSSTRFLQYEELKEATNNFAPASTLGEGRVLVEVGMLSILLRCNFVKLVGYYSSRDSSQNLLCYELVPNGSLEAWLQASLLLLLISSDIGSQCESGSTPRPEANFTPKLSMPAVFEPDPFGLNPFRRFRNCPLDASRELKLPPLSFILHTSGGGASGVLAGTATDGDVTKGAAFGPVTTAVLAEMAGLRQVVVVVVTEFSVG
ncbi:hypothetical protein F3Y22_tig00110578pilonHSYRG00081 [Hibiscus syriacus]|uniref:Uncharacterized protein n=1 Tax=Hibiscus syriacus TaxID=106335 RepID=A0A6A3A8J0_HIBSY|nr:hypothetical protein F3Y22_tig00110578pilonHSYRG00081 [Hibiscus syriacus]